MWATSILDLFSIFWFHTLLFNKCVGLCESYIMIEGSKLISGLFSSLIFADSYNCGHESNGNRKWPRSCTNGWKRCNIWRPSVSIYSGNFFVILLLSIIKWISCQCILWYFELVQTVNCFRIYLNIFFFCRNVLQQEYTHNSKPCNTWMTRWNFNLKTRYDHHSILKLDHSSSFALCQTSGRG